MTQVIITIQDESGRQTGARVVSFTTAMTPKETLQAMEVMATICRHYQPKDTKANV